MTQRKGARERRDQGDEGHTEGAYRNRGNVAGRACLVSGEPRVGGGCRVLSCRTSTVGAGLVVSLLRRNRRPRIPQQPAAGRRDRTRWPESREVLRIQHAEARSLP